MKTVTKFVLFSVSFPNSEQTSGEKIYFENEADAKRVAETTQGWYGSKGSVYESEFSEARLPKYYKSLKEYTDDCLTPNKAKYYNLI